MRSAASRHLPILTFINKLDQPGRDPLEILDEIEQLLAIRAVPMNWPIGDGADFKASTTCAATRSTPSSAPTRGEQRARWRSTLSRIHGWPPCSSANVTYAELREEVELLTAVGSAFDEELFRAGELTPVYFRQRAQQLWRRTLSRGVDGSGAAAPRPPEQPGPGGAHGRAVHRLCLQDPGQHGPQAPRPHGFLAHLLRPVRTAT